MDQYIIMLLPQLILIINQSDIKMDLLENEVLFMVYRMSNLKSKAFCIWCDLIISKILDDRFRHLMIYCSTVASWSNPLDLLKEKIIKVIDLLFFRKLSAIFTC